MGIHPRARALRLQRAAYISIPHPRSHPPISKRRRRHVKSERLGSKDVSQSPTYQHQRRTLQLAHTPNLRPQDVNSRAPTRRHLSLTPHPGVIVLRRPLPRRTLRPRALPLPKRNPGDYPPQPNETQHDIQIPRRMRPVPSLDPRPRPQATPFEGHSRQIRLHGTWICARTRCSAP